jgi:protein-disulfide isomerase
LERYAKGLQLDERKFQTCVSKNPHATEIQRDIAEAEKSGLSGTPSFVIGRTGKETIEGVRVVGAMPYASFDQVFKSLLNERDTPLPARLAGN